MAFGVFKAAVLAKTGSPLVIKELYSPELKSGQLRIKMLYSGVCKSQLMEQNGSRGEDTWLPHLLGHEGFGEVLECAPDVKKFNPGDKVILSWLIGEGLNSEPPSYLSIDGEIINSGNATTFSEITIASENRTFAAPKGFPDKVLPLFGCALLTGGGMALRYIEAESTQKVCILGFGGIGMSAALVAKGMYPYVLHIIESSPERLEAARKLGFESISSDSSKVNEKFDLVIESTGLSSGIEEGFDLIHDSGVLVFASHPKAGDKINLDPFELLRGKKIFGTWGGDVELEKDLIQISNYIKRSEIDVEFLCGQMFGLEEINEALHYLELAKAGRPIINLERL